MRSITVFFIYLWIPFFVSSLSMAVESSRTGAISDIYRQASAAVVRIESNRKVSASDHECMKFATGFIFDLDGYILTTADIVCDAENIHVVTSDNWRYPAKVVARDKKLNIAILKIPKKKFRTLVLGSSENVVPGTKVISITNPYGLTNTLAVGYVSGRYRSGFSKDCIENYIQTNLPLNPGDSGSPLMTYDGKVVGVMTAALVDDIPQGSKWIQPKGISFAIPIDFVKRNIPIMIRNGRANHLWIGLEVQNITRSCPADGDVRSGILVLSVFPNSPASKAGLRQGDLIIKASSTPIDDVYDFQSVVSIEGVDKRIEITIIRDGKELIVPVKATNMPENLIDNEI